MSHVSMPLGGACTTGQTPRPVDRLLARIKACTLWPEFTRALLPHMTHADTAPRPQRADPTRQR